MTEQARKNRGLVVRFMSATATKNGKDGDIMKMYDLARRLHRLEATLSRLASVKFDGDKISYSYYRKRNGKGSQKVFDCIRDLVKAIDEEVA